jgi:hypothetical protein
MIALSSSTKPSAAAAHAVICAPRSMSGFAWSSVRSHSRIPKSPAHHFERALISAPKLQQHIDEHQILLRLMDRRRVEIESRLVETLSDACMLFQQLARPLHIALANSDVELLNGRLRERFDLALHLRPGAESVTPRNDQLRVVKLQRIRMWRVWQKCIYALDRFGLARPHSAELDRRLRRIADRNLPLSAR